MCFAAGATACATVYNADPTNFKTQLSNLQPGDTLALAAGTYPPLAISGKHGTPNAWITITGPASGAAAIIAGAACCNTVQISTSSYLAVKNLTIDSKHIPGAFGIAGQGGTTNPTHDILIEGNTLINQDGSQQTDGISTKTPTWNWTIRKNTITGAGTGLYLGNSDGTMPFVAGIIEDNLVQDTIGYNMEIKWQKTWPAVAGMPTSATTTIIRNNVFIKNDQPSPDGDRPNLLVGPYPTTGPGSSNMYDIYGNFFFHNPREALFQGSGRFSVHDNVFVDSGRPALVMQPHDGPLQLAYVYNNTIYTKNTGIYFGSTPTQDHAVAGNLVFGGTPIAGPITNKADNISDTFANAAAYVASPSFVLGAMNFFPLPGKASGSAITLSKFAGDPGYKVDFNGVPKDQLTGSVVFRGAYAGEGTNPGWQLRRALKPEMPAMSVPATLACAPAIVGAGASVSCTLTMSAGSIQTVDVALRSDSAVLKAPATVSVPAGSTSVPFSMTAGSVATAVAVHLSATANGSTARAEVTVAPASSALGSLSCSPQTIAPGASSTCTVSMTGAAANNTTIALASSASAVAVPASVTVPAGAVSASFSAVAATPSSSQQATVSATLNGATRSAVLGIATAGSPRFVLNGNASEISGSTVTPSGSASLPGAVVGRGAGAVKFDALEAGNGVAFLQGGHQNSNTAFYTFKGSAIGSIFSASGGEVSFVMKSNETWATRQSRATYTYVYDVFDGGSRVFSFWIQPLSGRLAFAYITASTTARFYDLRSGQEDALFGAGVAAKVRITWNGSSRSLYVNDQLVQTTAYTPVVPSWTSTSQFVFGAAAPFSGGFYSFDDTVANFAVK